MPTAEEMAKAHLVNVENQIAQLEQQKVTIDSEVARLKEYLEEGYGELTESDEDGS
jgi:hypothetical protein|tara:strand:+ start:489 stop:656 length:168 start_codon:yes stop_codon:yes gene_type:complete